MGKLIDIDTLQHFNELLQERIGQMISESIQNAISGGSVNLIEVQSLYPVGSIYISTISTNPSQIFKFGTWERIEDTFLLAAGTQYSAGSTGGESVHTLTQSEIPSHTHTVTVNSDGEHTHTFPRHSLWRNENLPESSQGDGYGANNKTLTVLEDNTSSAGSHTHSRTRSLMWMVRIPL